jgi:hypothetical protein
MVYLLDYAPAGSELRLYRGHWGSGDNLPIEHFAAERPPFAATDGPDEFEQERQRELDFVERARAPRLQRAAASLDRPQRQLGGATGP